KIVESDEKNSVTENSVTEIPEEKVEEQIETLTEVIDEQTEVVIEPVVDSTKSVSNDSIKKLPKWGLYANIGMGALLANPPFADASRKLGERFFVNLEASRKNFSFRSGVDFQHFSFTNQ